MRDLGLDRDGAIVIERVDTTLSASADRAERKAPGLGVDAVVWHEIEHQTGEESALSAVLALGVGFPVGMIITVVATWLLTGAGLVTESMLERHGSSAQPTPPGRPGRSTTGVQGRPEPPSCGFGISTSVRCGQRPLLRRGVDRTVMGSAITVGVNDASINGDPA